MMFIDLMIMMITRTMLATRKEEGRMIKRKRSHRSESRTAKHCITPPIIIWIMMRNVMMIMTIMTIISMMVDDDG